MFDSQVVKKLYITRLLSNIKYSAENGRYPYYFTDPIPDFAIVELKKLGFKVLQPIIIRKLFKILYKEGKIFVE